MLRDSEAMVMFLDEDTMVQFEVIETELKHYPMISRFYQGVFWNGMYLMVEVFYG